MSINLIRVTAEKISSELQSSFHVMDGSASVWNHVAEQIRQWEATAHATLATEFPFLAHEGNLVSWERDPPASLRHQNHTSDAIDEYVSFCNAIGHPVSKSFWEEWFIDDSRKHTDDRSIATRLLLSGWRKKMDQARAEWELERIEVSRAAFKAKLDGFLRMLQQLHEQLEALGLETGILLDLSRGNLTAQDIEQFKRWAKYLAEDQGVRALCDLLGKIRQIEFSERIERVKSVAPSKIRLPDINSREEIVGVRLGRDIEHVLPAELALLADPDTAILFDLKYVEARLMCFDMQGIQNIHRHVETEEEQSVKDAEKQGPMVICIDTSGSMNGMPETIAKAVALFLATKAREQKRPCYLINFSTGIHTLDLGGDFGMDGLIRFLQMSFHGGTDVAPALDHALDTMKRDAYRNADLLIVSDFIMSGLPESILARIKGQRLNGSRFHSLVVGGCYMTQHLKSLFDNEWVYNPRNSSIHELVSFEQRLHGASTP
ncbi:VWA domain-containing protein [Insolitispirillum peregrinum]|uniref:Uncharacterized protein, contains a von Willebrand factor type A (VWA) domain n=1 Tax=Insolitispirillum peregrinum TaxID=80876 RepID=A0A1N7NK56_9PROT|nr:VWA domain-containing protein [Insolitispirillum peregrinum]SIS98692.1 Uncharacterized protein, contains a von Willebrand factor type A (vWA) domain [Insolitispirillum peregrinum]